MQIRTNITPLVNEKEFQKTSIHEVPGWLWGELQDLKIFSSGRKEAITTKVANISYGFSFPPTTPISLGNSVLGRTHPTQKG